MEKKKKRKVGGGQKEGGLGNTQAGNIWLALGSTARSVGVEDV